ncbi:MAG TPA: glycosyltransferase family 39 protein, partial [Blastocatellia bacterium]|nr:glycosyltransferase family 39 protein [Blastocatellia bacterium]
MQWLLPTLICLATFFTFAHFSKAHPIGTFATETDFYHLFAPDADRLSAGQFPQNDFQGPGYPALIALVTQLTGDTFIAGKWVSIISAAIISLLVFVLFARLFGYWIGIGAALLWAVAPEIPQFSIGATTDINFLVLCLAALCVFTSRRLPANWRVILTGIIVSLGYLSRYNGLFLLVTFLFAILALNIFERAWKDRAILAGLFIAAFLITASPWLYANYKHNGSPFYNANYLNIATEFYPELVNGNVFQDGTRPLREKFHSFGDVLLYNPKRIAMHYPANLYESFINSIKENLVAPIIGVLGLIGFALALWLKRENKAVLTMLTAFILYFLLMGLSHWEARYY